MRQVNLEKLQALHLRLLDISDDLERSEGQELHRKTHEIRELGGRLFDTTISQAWWTLGVGVVGGLAKVGANFTTHSTLKQMLDLGGGFASNSGTQMVTAFKEAAKVKLKTEQDLTHSTLQQTAKTMDRVNSFALSNSQSVQGAQKSSFEGFANLR